MGATVLYNDNDRHAAAWLLELIAEGHLPEGEVDERPIQEIQGSDLAGYRHVHLFAGIGGWAYALRLAGWPDDRPVWTGSCPCQPFSAAGKRKGQADERHLWPVFLGLIRQCRPPVVFGEQVASDDGYRWLARVRDDLEAEGYAVGCADLPACSQAAPHIRGRLFWVADARHNDRSARTKGRQQHSWQSIQPRLAGDCPIGGLADATSVGQQEHKRRPGAGQESNATDTDAGPGRLGRACVPRCEGRSLRECERTSQQTPWSGSVPIACSDGKARRIEPTISPLAHGIPGRVGLLRGAGNAIVPQVAAAFIRAYLSE